MKNFANQSKKNVEKQKVKLTFGSIVKNSITKKALVFSLINLPVSFSKQFLFTHRKRREIYFFAAAAFPEFYINLALNKVLKNIFI